MDIITYLLSMAYTKKSITKKGLRGKNCTIDSIVQIEGGHRITFKWTEDNGTVETETMDVMDGEDDIFFGTQEEWNALTEEEKNQYDYLFTTDDEETFCISIPEGGTAGQVLVKKSSEDYDAEWGTAFVASKNIFDKNNPNIHNNVYLNANGVEAASNTFSVVYMPCEENTTYIASNVNYSIGLFDSSMNLVRLIRTDEPLAYSFTTDAGTSILGVTVNHTNNFNIDTFMVIKGDSLPNNYVLGGLALPSDRIDGLDEALNKNVYFEQEKQYIDGNIELSWVSGFASITTGTLSNYSTETQTYNRSQVVKLNPNRYYRYTGHGKYDAGCCFYTSSRAEHNTFYSILPDDDYIMFKCPPNAPYIVFSNFTTEYPLENAHLEICFDDEYVNNFMKNAHSAKICCTGDSTTEGMGLNGSHYARYGESPYPARLKTILVDNGYDLEVVNQGHGGERMAAIMARIGAEPCTLNEDITILANNTPVSLGTPTVTNGLITGMKMEIPLNDVNGNPYNVSFTQISHDTNPVVIDGTRYTMTIDSNSKECFIAKETADNQDTVIPSDSIIFTKDDKNPLINIVYAGINDGSGLTFEIWLKGMKECIAANGGKTIVLGATNALFNWWSDLTGTIEQKYAEYKERATKELGLHFIDLYGEFSRHGVDLALSAGYLTDLTSEEIATMRQKLENHIMPSEFTVNGTENNVHLNEAGYHVIAMLVFERLKLLNYI